MIAENMKVLYIIDDHHFIGGAENGLVHLIDKGFFADSDLTIVGMFRGSGLLIDEIAKRNVSGGTLTIIDEKKMTVPLVIKSFFKLRKTIKEIAPDIIICSLERANIIARVANGTLRNKAFYVTFEHSMKYANRYFTALLKITSIFVNAVFYDHEITNRMMKRNYINHSKKHWFYVPLVSIKPQFVKKQYTSHKPFIVLSVCRLAFVKNHYESINAIKILNDKGINIKLKIAGEGDLEYELKEYVKKLNLENKVEFLGYVTDWQSMCENVDVFLQSSVHEGLCISVVEAMGCGLPIVSTDVGGMSEYGVDNHNMIKINGFKGKDIANSLEKLINDENLREKMGLQAKIDADKQFEEKIVREQLEGVFSSICNLY